jgi:hypothetical protein
MARDAILHSKKGNTKKYADLKATRHDQYPPQVTDEECDFRNDDPASEQVLHDTGPVLITPPTKR